MLQWSGVRTQRWAAAGIMMHRLLLVLRIQAVPIGLPLVLCLLEAHAALLA